MKLVIHNDSELSAAVAEHVAGLKRVGYNGTSLLVEDSRGVVLQCPPFATSADAVLPLLEKQSVVIANWILPDEGDCGWRVDIYDSIPNASLNKGAGALDKSFPRAACIALLRAAGHEVTFA